MKTEPQELHPPRALVLAAFATVYVVWGSTYLAMRVAIETLPPFLMAGCRFLAAGGVLFALLRFRGAPPPGIAHWQNGMISGFLLLVTGNGLVVWAEQTVPSGLTALLVGLTPAWFALIDWLMPGGQRPQMRAIVGILVGFGGMTLLVLPHHTPAQGASLNPWGVLALVAAGISWAGGSLFSKHHSRTESPWMTAALQMLCGGAALIVLALLTGEFKQGNLSHVSTQSLSALLYLIVFGSWIGFSAYVWLLMVSKPSHVATYAYVNPVIALLLGSILLGEPLDGRVLLAAAIILAGVVIITLPKELFVIRLPKGIPVRGEQTDPGE
jgi:drug/metabolite transporter (DMT)-like permease